jgi:TetR/AcrR family transcriptional repressor of nem operon
MGRNRTFDVDEALGSALRAFWEHGYDATSMQDLCRAMNIQPGSVYATFGNKRDLFVTTLRRYAETVSAEAVAQITTAPSGLQGLRDYFVHLVDAMVDGERRWGCLITNSLVEFATRDPELADLLTNHLANLRAAFAAALTRAAANGELRATGELRAAGKSRAVESRAVGASRAGGESRAAEKPRAGGESRIARELGAAAESRVVTGESRAVTESRVAGESRAAATGEVRAAAPGELPAAPAAAAGGLPAADGELAAAADCELRPGLDVAAAADLLVAVVQGMNVLAKSQPGRAALTTVADAALTALTS